MAEYNTTDVNTVLLSNSGYLKINNVEIAELSELEVKQDPEKKTLGIMNSPTKGEVTTAYTGTIKMKIHKVYSRWKPALLECAKNLQPFKFSLEATGYNPKKDGEETLYIDDCWFNGSVTLMMLKADAEFVDEEYEAGYRIETAEFTDTISDGIDWTSL